MKFKNETPMIVGHFGCDIRHNNLCSETGYILREKYNLVAARTPHEMSHTTIHNQLFLSAFSHFINEDTHAELLQARSIAGKPKIVITNTPDMIIAANERNIPVISFSCEFAGIAGYGFYAASAEAAANEIRRINTHRLAASQGIIIPEVA